MYVNIYIYIYIYICIYTHIHSYIYYIAYAICTLLILLYVYPTCLPALSISGVERTLLGTHQRGVQSEEGAVDGGSIIQRNSL